jgi:hypothetical protein
MEILRECPRKLQVSLAGLLKASNRSESASAGSTRREASVAPSRREKLGEVGGTSCSSCMALHRTQGLVDTLKSCSSFTNTMIDFGFAIGSFVPCKLSDLLPRGQTAPFLLLLTRCAIGLVAIACQNAHLEAQWRVSLAIGCVFPTALLLLRMRLKEPEEFSRNSMKHAPTPYRLVLRHYGGRLLVISLIWFIYDFLVYSFGLYSSAILNNLYPDGTPLTTVFGWNTVIMLFNLPGSLLGAKASDAFGPRACLVLGVALQGVVGFLMAGFYPQLARPELVGAFATVYGVFVSLGELGPGNNIGLLAAKSCATGIRGQYCE